MKIDTSDKRLLSLNSAGAAACGAVVILFLACGLRPLLGRAAAATTAKHRLEAAIVQRDGFDAAIRDENDRLQALHREMSTTAVVLQPPSKVNDLLARVSAISANCSVRLDDVRVGKLISGDRYATLPLHAMGRGTYRDCVRFLHELRRACPDVGVAEFSLGAAAGEINVDLELRWHTALPTTP